MSTVSPPRQIDAVIIDPGDGPLVLTWGRMEELGTCAYWIEQTRRYQDDDPTHRLGQDLTEEVAACMLGGFGMPAEVGLAAFRRLRDRGLITTDPPPDELELEDALSEPLDLGVRQVRYRYPRQRGHRLARALQMMPAIDPGSSPRQLRDFLLDLPGIGPKTASWVVRNHTGSDAVAIIDVHIHRAGLAAGFFRSGWRLPRDYHLFERAFLQVAEIGGVPASMMDGCIWAQLHQLGSAAELLLGRDAFELSRRS